MKIVRVGRKHVSYVSDRDFERVNGYVWYLVKRNDRDTLYAHTYTSPSKRIYMHDFIMRSSGVDHINSNGLDNTRDNLRIATPTQNGQNRRKQSTRSSSKYKGVTLDTSRGKPWKARITVDGHSVSLGRFDDEIEAAIAYDVAAVEYFGEFARLNFN